MNEMTAREDTIERIERCLKFSSEKSLTVTIPRLTAERAVSMLKEQEAKEVIIDLYGNYCPWCSTKTSRAMGAQKLHLGTKFCPYCGKAVKWNDSDNDN